MNGADPVRCAECGHGFDDHRGGNVFGSGAPEPDNHLACTLGAWRTPTGELVRGCLCDDFIVVQVCLCPDEDDPPLAARVAS